MLGGEGVNSSRCKSRPSDDRLMNDWFLALHPKDAIQREEFTPSLLPACQCLRAPLQGFLDGGDDVRLVWGSRKLQGPRIGHGNKRARNTLDGGI